MPARSSVIIVAFLATLSAGGCSADDADTGGNSSTATSTTTSSTASASVGDAGDTSLDPSNSGGSGSGGGGLPSACVEDSDCALDNDCCHCRAYSGELPDDHSCDSPPCFAPQCDGLGVSAARCVDLVCTPVVACDPSRVSCESLPPECPEEGWVPTVGPDSCWSGRCSPEERCTPGQ